MLLESDFSVLPKLLLEGRRVVNNVTQAACEFFIKTIYSVLLTIVCVLTNMPFPFIPIQITLIDGVIEAYPAFLTAFEPDGRRIDGNFLQTALKRALPNAAGITVAFLLFGFLPSFGLAAAEKITVLYLLVGFVSIQAVFKNNMLLTKLRIFALATTVCGYFIAILLFQKLLGLIFVLNVGSSGRRVINLYK